MPSRHASIRSLTTRDEFAGYYCLLLGIFPAATNGKGAVYENLIALSLLKWIHLSNDRSGTRYALQYFRDKDGHEVDFVITLGLKAQILVEAKLGDTDIHPGLLYLKRLLPDAQAFQIIGSKVKSEDRNDIHKVGVGEIAKIINCYLTPALPIKD